VPAWAIAAALAIAYLLIAPQSPDLAAADYRGYLFAHAGLTLWDNSWYGGHHLIAYSLLAPALTALLGGRLLAALSMTLATALFTAVIAGRFSPSATRIAAAWFALGAAIALLSSRVPFDLGLAIGLASIALAQRGRFAGALALALLTSLASPIAGAFLALAFLAWALAGAERRKPAALTLAALTPIALLALAFPEGGTQPFVASAFYPALAAVLVLAALIPSEQRVLRIGTLLYAAALIGSYLLGTAVGGNADRLGALAAGPVAACVLAGARGHGARGARARGARARLLLVLAPAFLYWQANAPLTDFVAAQDTPAVNASYYAPLLAELRALGVGYGATPARIEVVPSAVHWEARWLAPHVMLARGWERQLDRYRNSLFYAQQAALSPLAYRQWLDSQAISYVALADSPLDYSGRAEARMLRAGPPGYLRELWRSAHWRLFAVARATPLVRPAGGLAALGSDSFTLRAPRAGSYTVLVHFTPYWMLDAGHGCVARAAGDWTALRAPRAGSYRVVIGFSFARVFARGARCR
jgi:hypothetical protein